jgi:phage-related protein
MEMARLSSEYYIKLAEKENEELIKLHKMSWVEKGVYYVKQYWDKIQPYLNFKTIFKQTGEMLRSLWNGMINFNPFEGFSNGFKIAFDYVYDYISKINLYEVGVKTVQGFKNGFVSVLESLTSPMQYVLEGLSEGFSINGILNTFKSIGDAFGSVNSFMGGFGLSWSSITKAIQDFNYVKYFEACGEALDELVKVGAEFVLTFGEFTATQFINGLIQTKDFALDVFNTLYDSVFEIGDYFATKFIDALIYAKDFMNGEFLNSIKSIAESFATLPKNLIDSFAGLNNTVQIFDDHNLDKILADYKTKIDALKSKGNQDTAKIDEYEKLIKEMEESDLSLIDEEKLKTYKKELEELKKVGLTPVEQDELKALEDTYKTLQERFDNSFTNQLAKFKAGIADAVEGLQNGIPKMVASLKESFPTIMSELFTNTIALIPTIAKAFTDIAPVLVDGIINEIPKLTEALSKALPEILTIFKSLIPKLSTSFFQIINDIVDTLKESLPNLIKNLMPTITTIIGNISSLLQAVIPILGGIAKDFVPDIFNTFLKEIPKVVTVLSNTLKDLLPTLGDLASSFIDSLGLFLSKEAPSLIDSIAKQLPKLITSLTGLITTSLPTIIDSFVRNLPTIINALVESFPKIINSLSTEIPKVISAVLKELPRVIERLLISAGDFVFMMIKALPGFITQLLNAVPTIITELTRELPRLIQSVVRAIPEIILAITNSLPSIIRAVVDSAPQIMSSIALALPQLVSALAQKAPEIIQSLVRSFPELVRGIATYAPNMVAEIVRQLPTIIGSIIASLPQIMSAIIRMIPSLLYSISAEFPLHLYNAMRNLGNQVWYAIRDGVNSIGSAIESLFRIPASAWGRGTVENFLGIDLPWVRFAEGGHVGGTAKVAGNSLKNDVIPAMLSPGEFVLDRETIRNGDTSIIQTLAQQGVLSPSALEGMGFQLHGFGGWISSAWDKVKDWTGSAGDILGNVGSSVLKGLQSGASGAWKWIKTGTGQVVKWGRDALPDIWDLLKQLGGGVFESAKAIWDYNRNAINVWDVLSNPFQVIKNAFNNIVGGLMKDKAGGIVRGMMGMANGGMVGGTAKVQGDSNLNDLIPTLLSAGEMVIPRSFVQDGIQGVMSFASSVLGSKGQMEMSQGGFVTPTNFSQGTNDSTLNELKEIKSLLNSLGFTLGKNTLEQKKVLERWDYNGMPPVRT